MNIIIGRKPVLEALNSNEEVEQVYILFGQQGNIINAIRVAAKKRGIKCNQIPLERFRTYAPSQNAQGVVALKQDFKFSSLDEIIAEAKKTLLPLILILDEIQDPHNVGAILRSAECSGVNGVILTKHNSATITSTVAKTSAGATEINTQQNFWPAEICNLSECHEPLFDLIRELSLNGRKTAETNYGARGWVAHHNTDIWRQSSPVGDCGHGDSTWALWPMSGPWLCQHLWQHYEFGGDKAFLHRTAYPLMKGAAEFCLDFLIEDGKGHLVTAPSTSPENRFVAPDGKKRILLESAPGKTYRLNGSLAFR